MPSIFLLFVAPFAAVMSHVAAVLLLFQIVTILAVARLLRWMCRPLRQPAVVGEMIAGLLLGPSCFGAIAPSAFASVFPASSLAPMGTLSQIGLVLFMFGVGRRIRTNTSETKPA